MLAANDTTLSELALAARVASRATAPATVPACSLSGCSHRAGIPPCAVLRLAAPSWRRGTVVSTALYKAAQTGVLHGFAAAAERAQAYGVELRAAYGVAADIWQERYGDEPAHEA